VTLNDLEWRNNRYFALYWVRHIWNLTTTGAATVGVVGGVTPKNIQVGVSDIHNFGLPCNLYLASILYTTVFSGYVFVFRNFRIDKWIVLNIGIIVQLQMRTGFTLAEVCTLRVLLLTMNMYEASQSALVYSVYQRGLKSCNLLPPRTRPHNKSLITKTSDLNDRHFIARSLYKIILLLRLFFLSSFFTQILL